MVDSEINPDDGLGVGGDWVATHHLAAEGHEPPAGLLFDSGREHPGRAGHHLVGQRRGVLLGPDDAEPGQLDMAVVEHPDHPGAEAATWPATFLLEAREPHGLAGPGATS